MYTSCLMHCRCAVPLFFICLCYNHQKERSHQEPLNPCMLYIVTKKLRKIKREKKNCFGDFMQFGRPINKHLLQVNLYHGTTVYSLHEGCCFQSFNGQFILTVLLLQEGTSNYFKGLMLVLCYLIVAASFFVHVDPSSGELKSNLLWSLLPTSLCQCLGKNSLFCKWRRLFQIVNYYKHL